MKLTHVCPKCKKEHEMEQTPEPDQLCPECMPLLSARIVVDIDCINTTINQNEENILEQEIRKIIEGCGMKVTRLVIL